jgi:methylmalonyl-CoA mutase N-terminal domain/subunit
MSTGRRQPEGRLTLNRLESSLKPGTGVTPVVFRADPGARDRQIERLKRIRSDRDEKALEGSLIRLAEAIDKEENVFPFVLDAVKHYGTLGKIIKVMTDVYGRYRDLTII